MSEHRIVFKVRRGGARYFNTRGEETDANGVVLRLPEADYFVPNPEQIIAERRRLRDTILTTHTEEEA